MVHLSLGIRLQAFSLNLLSPRRPFPNPTLFVCSAWAACASSGNAADFDENFLNIIVARSATNSTWVDGSLLAATNFVAIGTSGYYGARLIVTSGVHRVTSSQPVGVEVYGWGIWDAYGYFGGIVK